MKLFVCEGKEKEEKMFLPLNLQFFAEGGDGSGGGEEGAEGEEHEEDDDEGAEKKEGKKKSKRVTFEQAELSRMMANEKKQGRLAVLKELGIDTDDVKSNKDAMEKFREWQKSQRTDLENAQEELKEMQKIKNANNILEAKVEALSLGAKPDCLDDLIALCIVKVDDEHDLQSIMKDMKSKYPMFFGDSERKDEDEEDVEERGTGRAMGASGKKGKEKSYADRYAERRQSAAEVKKNSSYFR